MGPLGYQSEAQSALAVSYNSLSGYARSLNRALTEPYPPYEAIGIRDGDDYKQLATTLLQIENEFYGTIRPKRRIRPGERPLCALGDRGVEYVEVRCMDIDPFLPVGIDASIMRFLDVFLLHCLLTESPPDSPAEIAALLVNQHRAADRGRAPDPRLRRGTEEVGLRDWGRALLAECAPIAEALDAAHGGQAHRDALARAADTLGDASRCPSARVLAALHEQHGDSFLAFGLAQSAAHRAFIRGLHASPEDVARFAEMARTSRREQAEIEAADTMSFETYRQNYLAQPLMAGAQFQEVLG
jgi:glutamate--cysteine ligase